MHCEGGVYVAEQCETNILRLEEGVDAEQQADVVEVYFLKIRIGFDDLIIVFDEVVILLTAEAEVAKILENLEMQEAVFLPVSFYEGGVRIIFQELTFEHVFGGQKVVDDVFGDNFTVGIDDLVIHALAVADFIDKRDVKFDFRTVDTVAVTNTLDVG